MSKAKDKSPEVATLRKKSFAFVPTGSVQSKKRKSFNMTDVGGKQVDSKPYDPPVKYTMDINTNVVSPQWW